MTEVLAARLRTFTNLVAERDLPPTLAGRLSRALDDLVHAVSGVEPRRPSEDEIVELDTASRAGGLVHPRRCVISGRESPIGLGIVPERVGASVRAAFDVGATFEGAPGVVHGGIVAAIFDDMLAYAAALDRGFVVTKDLSVRFLAPTPSRVELAATARVTGAGDRVVNVEGTIVAGDTTTATAAASYVVRPGGAPR